MFVILQPHSRTNDSDEYRVVDSVTWQKFANGAANAYAIASRHTKYADAVIARDRLNRG